MNEDTLSIVSSLLGVGLSSAGDERVKEFLFDREREGERKGAEVGLPAAPMAPARGSRNRIASLGD